jgi:tetratricopeptide (TPR) repeat protein
MLTNYVFLAFLAVQGSSRDSLLAEGIRLAAMRPAEALPRFEALLARDSTDVEANWRAATALNDVAAQLTADVARTRRDSLLANAQLRARRAVRLAPDNTRALFVLGLVLGNTALTRGIKERVRLAVEIRDLALRSLAADSLNDGAHHLLGRWNYEVMKLSGFERLVARTFLGGGVMRKASWEEARRELSRAVALDSTRIYHRLDLAHVQLATHQQADASIQLRAIARTPIRFAADSGYQREARALLERIR